MVEKEVKKEQKKYLVVKQSDIEEYFEKERQKAVKFDDAFHDEKNTHLLKMLGTHSRFMSVLFGIAEMRLEQGKKDNKYIICNQDEPYAEKVWELILQGEREKQKKTQKEMLYQSSDGSWSDTTSGTTSSLSYDIGSLADVKVKLKEDGTCGEPDCWCAPYAKADAQRKTCGDCVEFDDTKNTCLLPDTFGKKVKKNTLACKSLHAPQECSSCNPDKPKTVFRPHGVLWHCSECGKDWYSKVFKPVRCPDCRKPKIYRLDSGDWACRVCGAKNSPKNIRCSGCRSTKKREVWGG